MANLPIKARVLEYFALNEKPISAQELSQALSGEYPGEKIVLPDWLEKTILCYCRVGMLEPVGMTADGALRYQVTAAGKDELAYIPGHGNKLW